MNIRKLILKQAGLPGVRKDELKKIFICPRQRFLRDQSGPCQHPFHQEDQCEKRSWKNQTLPPTIQIAYFRSSVLWYLLHSLSTLVWTDCIHVLIFFFFQEGTITNPAIWVLLSEVRILLSLTTVTVTAGNSAGECHVQLVFVNELAVIVDLFHFYTPIDD